MGKPLILLSNDDGFRAEGLRQLRAQLNSLADVIVCAPEHEQSAASHALTLHRPLRLREQESGIFSLDGSPADCVYTALYGAQRLLLRQPDLVVSGINHGLNLGDDVFYSGTVAAAREGALRGIPAMAISAGDGCVMSEVAAAVRPLVEAFLAAKPARALLLNVNVPPGAGPGFLATRLGHRAYRDEVEFRKDPRGKEYLWLGGPPGALHTGDEAADTAAFDRGRISVTPLSLSLWAREQQPELSAMLAGL